MIGAVSRPVAETTELTRVQELIYELKIEQVMTKQVITVTQDTRMGELKEVLRVNRISGVPVLEEDRLAGIVSIEDLIKALEEGDIEATVGQKMTRDVYTVCYKDSVIEAVKLFKRHGVGRLPAVDPQGQLVGILTSGDIILGLLHAIGLDYHAEEIRKYRASHIFEDIVSDQTSLVLHYEVPAKDLSCGGEASSKIKKALHCLGSDPAIARRVAIATYEAEMNLVIHTDNGGEIAAEICPDRIRILVVDDGPGIPDVQLAMQPGYSTAPDWIRSLGFSAGMGLVNIERCADELNIQSEPGAGTRVEIRITVPEGELPGQSTPE